MILDTYYMCGKPRIRKLKKIVSQKKKKILASPFTDRAAFGFGYYMILRVTFIEPFDAFCLFTHLSADSWRSL